MRTHRGAVVIAALALVATVLAVARGDTATSNRRSFAGLMLVANAESWSRTVTVPALPDLPERATAYEVRPPSQEDLRGLAERHAGGPVQRGLRNPRAGGDLVGFDTGDGWMSAQKTAFAPLRAEGPSRPEDWTWAFEARSALPGTPRGCGAEQPPLDAALEFFAELGLDVVPTWRGDCSLGDAPIRFDVLVGGVPVTGLGATASIGRDGQVLSAAGPFPVVRYFGDYPLAPVGEVVRRARSGPGFLPGFHVCEAPCRLVPDDPALGLALVTDGGNAGHDHILEGDGGPTRSFLVPALRLTAPDVAGDARPRPVVVALSSSVLVDDPAAAGAARRADETAAGSASPGGCEGDESFLLCLSSDDVPAGEPIVVTVYADLHQPGGADCRPEAAVDPDDGSDIRSFAPGGGSLVTGRVTAAWAEPGRHVVRAHRFSACASPPPGGGTEPEYDDVLERTVVVR